MLVDLEDKPSKFVGSREWIGAIELSYILDTHMGVSLGFTPGHHPFIVATVEAAEGYLQTKL